MPNRIRNHRVRYKVAEEGPAPELKETSQGVLLSDLAARHGLTTENTHIVRQKRVGASIVSSSVRQGAKTTVKLYESAVVLTKKIRSSRQPQRRVRRGGN